MLDQAGTLRFAELPLTVVEQRILQVCVAPAANVPAAVERLVAAAGARPNALAALRPSIVALLALLAVRALPDAASLPAGWVGRLRTALALERTRAREFGKIAGGILADARMRSLEPLVSKGAAIAATSYPEGFERHTSRLSLLVRDQGAYAAAEALLLDHGCRLESNVPSRSRQVYRHSSGMPVFVFGGRNCTRMRDFHYDTLRATAREAVVAGQIAMVPAPQALWTELVYRAYALKGEIGPQWFVDAAWFMHAPGFDPFDLSVLHQDSRITLPYRAYAEQLARWLSSDREASFET
ncbi:MAG: nucleotidyltransferase family protein [Rhodobacteraceae bacterium]|nr:nucleotidyltransferase family protein [Paracoccaceae bacterium]